MTRPRALILAAGLAGASISGLGLPAMAELSLPTGAALQASTETGFDAYQMPVGRWTADTGVPSQEVAGKISRAAWRLGGTGLSSYQLFINLRAQLEGEGYDVLFECGATQCGGFDFRYGTEVIGEPDMHVDIGDYWFLSAKGPADEDAVSLLVSRSASAAYVQIIEVGAGVAPSVADTVPAISTKAEPGAAISVDIPGEIGAAMEEVGRFVLTDLDFGSGSSELGAGSYDSLSELADYLKADPTRRVALVGHTDATGSLSANIAISRKRAESVMARLVGDYGVPAAQLEADGIGYLSPLASNQTEAGRTLNRRVEAILVSTN